MEYMRNLVGGIANRLRGERNDDGGMESGAFEQPQGYSDGMQVIGEEEIDRARQTLQEYKRGKANLEQRIIDNERWYQLRHWDAIKGREGAEPDTSSAWLFNCIANKHADAMDNYPDPVVLPREQSDQQAAQMLSDVLPAVLEQNDFEKAYSDVWWYKLKTGTGVYGVFWDSSKQNGIGDITIRQLDLLNLFWEPGITDIQKSQNIFHVELLDNEILKDRYPQLERELGGNDFAVAQYIMDESVDTSKKSVVVDWYYKRMQDGKEVLHYCKFCGNVVLYASENDPQYAQTGFYNHGKYPFVFDVLFPEAAMPVGFGYVDVCRSPQLYIDALDRAILKNAVMSATPRFFVRKDGAINVDEYADWNKPFVNYTGASNPNESIMPIVPPTLPAAALNVRTEKIEELKETSGNRDFSQGGTSSGVTAASAIAALQEAGSKLSRDMIKSAYRAFREVNTLCIELMRQFYDFARYFRIIGENGKAEFVQFSNAMIGMQPQGDDFGNPMGERLPVFDVRVVSQKASPFSVAAQNERAKELYAMGFFLPQNADQSLAALDMMQFEGIEEVRQRIAQNGTMFQMIQQLQMQVAQLGMIVDAQNGTNIAQGAAMAMSQQGAPVISGGQRGETEVNALGEATAKAKGNSAAGAREKAARSATPR